MVVQLDVLTSITPNKVRTNGEGTCGTNGSQNRNELNRICQFSVDEIIPGFKDSCGVCHDPKCGSPSNGWDDLSSGDYWNSGNYLALFSFNANL